MAAASARRTDVYYVENVDPATGRLNAIWVAEDGAVHFCAEDDRYYSIVQPNEAVKMALVILERKAESDFNKGVP